jgi:hypothetical protein
MSSRAAPPVSVRCSGGLRWQAVQTALSALAAWAASAWALQSIGLDIEWAAFAGLSTAALAFWLARPRPHCLSFNGERWDVDGVVATQEVMLDAFGLLLLRLRAQPAGATSWLACTEGEAGAAYHALRVALYAHPKPAGSAVAAPSPAGN